MSSEESGMIVERRAAMKGQKYATVQPNFMLNVKNGGNQCKVNEDHNLFDKILALKH